MFTAWQQMVYLPPPVVIPPYPTSPWLTSPIASSALYEIVAAATYKEKDGWLNSAITNTAVYNNPIATSIPYYRWAPSNVWLRVANDSTASAVAPLVAPSTYKQVNP